jgi:hypothetical protein
MKLYALKRPCGTLVTATVSSTKRDAWHFRPTYMQFSRLCDAEARGWRVVPVELREVER